MSTVNIFQVSLEIWGIIFSLILAISTSSTVSSRSSVLKNAWTMLLLNCMLLSCDSLAYVYRGDLSTIGFVMTQFGTFGIFLIEGILAWLFTYVVQQIITGKKKISMKSTPMVIASACTAIQLLGTALTPFTKLYYSFDAQNYYVRESCAALPFLLLGIVLAVNFFEIIRHGQKFSGRLWGTFIGAAVIVTLCTLAQFIFYGISLIIISITLAVIILFLNLLADSAEQHFARHVSGMEDVIKELSINKSKENAQ